MQESLLHKWYAENKSFYIFVFIPNKYLEQFFNLCFGDIEKHLTIHFLHLTTKWPLTSVVSKNVPNYFLFCFSVVYFFCLLFKSSALKFEIKEHVFLLVLFDYLMSKSFRFKLDLLFVSSQSMKFKK